MNILVNRSKAITQRSLLKNLCDLVIGGWFVILLVILKPIKKIYLAPLNSSRMGHFVMDTEILLARIHQDELTQNTKLNVIWFSDSLICNNFVFKIWQQKLTIMPYSKLTASIFSSAVTVEKITKIKLTYRFNTWDGYLRYIHLLETSPKVFEISKQLEEECLNELESQGIDTTKKWVCILDRNSQYLEKHQPDKNWNFNDYRNTDINTYLDAAEYLAKKDIYIFRMGNLNGPPLSSAHTNLIIDYCNSNWSSDKLDIFLSLNCLFFLGSANGLSAIPVAARKPLLDVNLALPLHAIRFKSNHIFIMKKFIHKKTRLPIDLHDYLDIGTKGGFTIDNPRHLRSQDLEKFNILVFDNTSTEILEATEEMLDLVTNSSELASKISAEQMDFWRIFPNVMNLSWSGPPKSRIGQKFLLANNYLLQKK